MTTQNYTKIEIELLELCKEYIRVLDIKPHMLAHELMSSITQVFDAREHDIIERFKKLESPKID
jgi:hypothetical protein